MGPVSIRSLPIASAQLQDGEPDQKKVARDWVPHDANTHCFRQHFVRKGNRHISAGNGGARQDTTSNLSPALRQWRSFKKRFETTY
jgi:hypothetical protein